jgi:hypothetical protein
MIAVVVEKEEVKNENLMKKTIIVYTPKKIHKANCHVFYLRDISSNL